MIIDSQIWKHELEMEVTNFGKFISEIDFNSQEDEEDDISDENYDSLSDYRQVGNLTFITLQKFAVYSSIIIRKLIEAEKISDELLNENFAIQTYLKNKDKKITKWNAFEIEELYELDKPKKTSINLKNLTDKIIHSYHFMPKYEWSKIDKKLADEDSENWRNEGLEGFYFSSDKTKEKELFFISIKQYIKSIKEVTSDFIILKEFVGNKLVVNSKNIKK